MQNSFLCIENMLQNDFYNDLLNPIFSKTCVVEVANEI